MLLFPADKPELSKHIILPALVLMPVTTAVQAVTHLADTITIPTMQIHLLRLRLLLLRSKLCWALELFYWFRTLPIKYVDSL
jgi:hypothetical protein